MTVTVPSGRRTRTKLIWMVPAFGFVIVLAPIVLLAGAGNPPCASIASSSSALNGGPRSERTMDRGQPEARWVDCSLSAQQLSGAHIPAAAIWLWSTPAPASDNVSLSAANGRNLTVIRGSGFGQATGSWAGDILSGSYYSSFHDTGRRGGMAAIPRPVCYEPGQSLKIA